MARDFELLINLRSRGKCVVGENTESNRNRVAAILADLGTNYATLDASNPEDATFASLIPTMTRPGAVVVLNFHLLPGPIQDQFAQYMKLAADFQEPAMKVIALGDENTAFTLVGYADDLCLRMGVIHPL